MAKYIIPHNPSIDIVFHALSDPTRRDILERLSQKNLTMSEVAHSYDFSFPTITKHVAVLQKAKLVKKEKRGRENMLSLKYENLKVASDYVAFYKKYWSDQLANLETFLEKGGEGNE